MKKFSLFLLAMLSLNGYAQRYHLTGRAKSGEKIYLFNAESNSNSKPDSTVCVNGRFSFSGDAKGKLFGFVVANSSKSQTTAILDGNVTVDLLKGQAHGTPENNLYVKAYAKIEPFIKEMIAVRKIAISYQKQNKKMPKDVEARLRKKYDIAEDSIGIVLNQICQDNKEHIFPAILVKNFFYVMNKKDLFNYMKNKYRFMMLPIMKSERKELEGLKRQMPGQKFVDITLADTAGVSHNISEYLGKGKYVLLDFWASWCGPCRASMPAVKALYKKYHAKGFDIVGLSFDQRRSSWVGAIKQLGLPWHHLSDLKGWQTKPAQVYGVRAIPNMLLVGPDGKIVANGLEGESLRLELEKIFK